MADAGKMEVNALLSALNGERDHVLGTLEGLSDESLRRPVLPSGWTCLGLVQHLPLDVERFWFCEIVTRQTTETAVHAGHLDAVRELIDGRQWLVLT